MCVNGEGTVCGNGEGTVGRGRQKCCVWRCGDWENKFTLCPLPDTQVLSLKCGR